jgi:hypothetical protein
VSRFERSFNPADAAIVVCDEDPTTSLIEWGRIERGAIGDTAEERLGEHILAGLSAPVGLLDHLRENGITPEQVRLAASKLYSGSGSEDKSPPRARPIRWWRGPSLRRPRWFGSRGYLIVWPTNWHRGVRGPLIPS